MMNNLKDMLQALTNRIVHSSSVGGGVGSIIKLVMDTDDFLFIYCTWRLEHKEMVLSTSEDNAEPAVGLMARTIKELDDKKIIKIEFTSQYDLVFFLEDDYVLRIFCNVSYSNEGYSNWELCCPQKNIVYTVNNHFKIDITTYF